MRTVYLDHSATTPVDPEVFEAMKPYFLDKFGNASSIHERGREARAAVEEARAQVARLLGAEQPREIIFTSGATESDNLAVKGVAMANRDRGDHIITTRVEHHAILHTCELLEKEGFQVTYLPVDSHGVVDPADVEQAITPQTVLVTVMLANNEVGTVLPVREIGEICREREVYFHTDAVQTLGMVEVDVNQLGVDLLSLSGHKMYGPKGVGALYVRRGTRLGAVQHGGSHERHLRAGTENVSGIVGLGKAAELAGEGIRERAERVRVLRDRLWEGLSDHIAHLLLNGHPEKRLPHVLNFSVLYVEGESLLLNLDMAGIQAASGSACTSGSLEPSHVLLAMDRKHEEAHGSLRLSLGKGTTREDVDYVIETLPGIVERLRQMSPLYEEKE